jgi:two-component system nitrate/nitrite sensor histidine kinase NarX
LSIATDITALKQAEALLAEQASQLAAIFEAQSDGVAVYDREGRFVRANPAMLRLLGAVGDPEFMDRLPDARAQRLQLFDEAGQLIALDEWPYRRALRGETLAGASALEVQLRTQDGRQMWTSITGGPMRGPDGTISGVVLVLRDITTRHRLELQVADQERQYRTLVEHSPDIIARFDRELRYLYINRAVLEVLSVPPVAYRGKTNAELGWPEAVYAPAHQAIAQVFETGQPQTLEESDADLLGPEAAHYYRAQFLPERATDGHVESVLTVTTEITALKRTEQALRVSNAALQTARQEEERRKQIAESLRDVLAVVNSSRSPQEVLQTIVCKVEGLLGSDAAVVYGPDHLGDHLPSERLAAALRVQAAHHLRFRGRRASFPRRLPFAGPAVVQALTSTQPVALAQACECPPSDGAAGEPASSAMVAILRGSLPAPYQAVLVVPIRVRDEIYGCLLLFYKQPCRFAAEEVALAQAYADQAGLAITNARLQAHIAQEAIEAERSRLARELHDTVTQEIFSASLLAEGLPRIWETHRSQAEGALGQLHPLLRSAQAGLRALLLELRPGALEQAPLAEALEKLAAAMSVRAGGPVRVDIADDARAQLLLPAAVKVVFYRVAQEALMNAIKHAQAQTFTLRLRTQRQGQIELEVADDGLGFDPSAIPAGHFGLAMMRERARAVGATVQIRSQVGHGTQVSLTWRKRPQDPSVHGEGASDVRNGAHPRGRGG